MSSSFLADIESRRSTYQLGASSPIPDERIVEIVRHAVKHSPTAFNIQESRVVVLFKDQHVAAWESVKSNLRPLVPAAAWPVAEQRVDLFKGAYGTMLLFEDKSCLSKLQENFPPWAGKTFPEWDVARECLDGASAMLAFSLWTALCKEGLGCNFQHFNPLFDTSMLAGWGVPESWELKAQLVFGQTKATPDEKTFMPLEDRILIAGL